MEIIKKYQGFIAIGLAAVGLVALVAMSSNNDQADTAKTDEAKKAASADKSKDDTKTADAANNGDNYTYKAGAGDSYTVLARKSVQAYAAATKVKLSPAQIIAAETRLTVDAGSILLNEGQTVAIKKSAVKSAVEVAQKLKGADLAAWEVYVPYVDFS